MHASSYFATQDQVDQYKRSYWRADEQYIVDHVFTKKDASLLTLGCGGGRTLPRLHQEGYDLTAIDLVPEMVASAREKMRGTNVSVEVMDATALTYPDARFDYVFFPFHGIDCVEPSIYDAVVEAARVLKDDGVFVFNSHNRLYFKALHRLFAGAYQEYEGLTVYRATPWDQVRLKRYFHSVRMVQRISLLPWKKANWKDKVYKLLPWFNKSTYFICSRPRRA